MKTITIITLLLSLEAVAQKTKNIRDTLNAISSLNVKSFPKKISPLRLKVEKFINYQKKICQGEFSTIVLNEFSTKIDGNEKNELKKLDKNEKKICFRKLKNIQSLFINAVHQARSNYLQFIHQQEIEGLDSIRKKSLQGLDKAFL